MGSWCTRLTDLSRLWCRRLRTLPIRDGPLHTHSCRGVISELKEGLAVGALHLSVVTKPTPNAVRIMVFPRDS